MSFISLLLLKFSGKIPSYFAILDPVCPTKWHSSLKLLEKKIAFDFQRRTAFLFVLKISIFCKPLRTNLKLPHLYIKTINFWSPETNKRWSWSGYQKHDMLTPEWRHDVRPLLIRRYLTKVTSHPRYFNVVCPFENNEIL